MSVTEALQSSQNYPIAQPQVESGGFFSWFGDQFWGFYNWVGSFFSSGEETFSYELTPEQKARIEEIYIQALNILRDMDAPLTKEDVADFLELIKRYYERQNKILKAEADSHYQSYEFNRKKVQKHEEEERREYEKMMEAAAASSFWQKMIRAIVPIYTGIAAIALPPGLNVAVIAVSVLFFLEEASDHALTETIADMSSSDPASKETIAQRLQFVSSLMAFGVSLPVSAVSSIPLAVLLGISKAGTEIGTTCAEMSKSQRQAEITRLKAESLKFSRKMGDQLNLLKKTYEAQSRATRETWQLIEAQRKAVSFKRRG